MLPRKDLFELPEGVIYLDGNSLGPLPRGTRELVGKTVSEGWGGHLIRGWNDDNWMAQPVTLARGIERLIGAAPGSTVLGDTLSIKVHQALSASLSLRPDRRVILSDTGNFPSDLYMAEGLIAQLDRGHSLRLVAPDEVSNAIDQDVAVVMLTHVDYRSGRMHDLEAITRRAQKAGAVMLWDLAHSAGAVPLEIANSECEFAVGCTYKYINAGPGAPAFISVRPDLLERIDPALAGWLGHADPFAFEPEYRPASSIERFRVGTPAVLQMAALQGALAIWNKIDINDVRAACLRLSDLFIQQVESHIPELELVSPRAGSERGSQVSFSHPEGYAIIQALAAVDVIGDFRAPDILRFGITPLYLDDRDIIAAVDRLESIMRERAWDHETYKRRQRVT
ncbi:MAG: kynureninase [Pseudomonadota bacterium]